jgi:hypothetical protein
MVPLPGVCVGSFWFLRSLMRHLMGQRTHLALTAR